jgi:hypothetical protein
MNGLARGMQLQEIVAVTMRCSGQMPDRGSRRDIEAGFRKRRCQMMVVAVGITSEDVRSLAGTAVTNRGVRAPGLAKCLIVSGDRGFRNRLEAVAELAGWSECDAPVEGVELGSVIESDYQLVVVDIARPIGERVNDSVEIAEEFAGRPDSLLAICGSDDNVDEELWARQLGAWVYLPGVSSGDALLSLVTEARRLAERRGVFQAV